MWSLASRQGKSLTFRTLSSVRHQKISAFSSGKSQFEGKGPSKEQEKSFTPLLTLGLISGVGGVLWWKWGKRTAHMKSSPVLKLKGVEDVGTQKSGPTHQLVHSPKEAYIPPARPDLPIITREEVKKQNGSGSDRIWVTYSGGVYDITEFIQSHPGGKDKIMLAAGGNLEPFWKMYAQHKTPEVAMILEELRIGTLDPKEVIPVRETNDNDPYANEPERHPAMLVNSQTPFNAETPPLLINDSFLTQQDIFYVRNHLPVPKTNADTHELKVEIGKKKVNLSMKELKKKFRPVSITAAVQCAGNRRNKMSAAKSVQGLGWGFTAIGNAEWTGYRLKDILEASGASLNDYAHVICEGADKDMTGTHYETSIPIEKALHPDTILAFQMNGEPLSRDHGYPLRLIAPGIVGARQVKWLSRISLSKAESGSHWQQRDYRAFSPSADPANPDYSKVPSIQEGPVQSAICSPSEHTVHSIEEKTIHVEGYAWSGGGRGIVRVDISTDGGKTWTGTDLKQDPRQSLENMWAWTLWETEAPIPKKAKPGETVEIICKATDRSYNNQPETVDGIWNYRGLLNNSWHRVNVKLGK